MEHMNITKKDTLFVITSAGDSGYIRFTRRVGAYNRRARCIALCYQRATS